MNMEILKKIRPLRMNGVSLPEIRRLKGVQNAFDFYGDFVYDRFNPFYISSYAKKLPAAAFFVLPDLFQQRFSNRMLRHL